MVKNICFVGQQHYFDVCTPSKMEGYKVHSLNVNFEPSQPERFNVCLELQQETPIDHWVFFRGEYAPRQILNRLEGHKTWVSTEPINRPDIQGLYFGQNKLFAQSQRQLFDSFVHYDETETLKLNDANYNVSESFPLPVKLDVYKQESAPKLYDFIFLGRMNERRASLTGALKKDYSFLSVDNGMYSLEAVRAYNMSRIGVNLQVEDFRQFPHRIQNMMACGLPIVSDDTTQNSVYEGAAIKFIKNNSPQEMYRVCNDLARKDDGLLEAMGKVNRKICEERFDASKNWKELMEGLNG